MVEIIIGLFLIAGALVMLVASIGIITFKYLMARLHVVIKASSFALMLILIGINLLFLDLKVLIQSLIIFHVLVFLSPVSAHLIARITKLLKLHDQDNHETQGEEDK